MSSGEREWRVETESLERDERLTTRDGENVVPPRCGKIETAAIQEIGSKKNGGGGGFRRLCPGRPRSRAGARVQRLEGAKGRGGKVKNEELGREV